MKAILSGRITAPRIDCGRGLSCYFFPRLSLPVFLGVMLAACLPGPAFAEVRLKSTVSPALKQPEPSVPAKVIAPQKTLKTVSLPEPKIRSVSPSSCLEPGGKIVLEGQGFGDGRTGIGLALRSAKGERVVKASSWKEKRVEFVFPEDPAFPPGTALTLGFKEGRKWLESAEAKICRGKIQAAPSGMSTKVLPTSKKMEPGATKPMKKMRSPSVKKEAESFHTSRSTLPSMATKKVGQPEEASSLPFKQGVKSLPDFNSEIHGNGNRRSKARLPVTGGMNAGEAEGSAQARIISPRTSRGQTQVTKVTKPVFGGRVLAMKGGIAPSPAPATSGVKTPSMAAGGGEGPLVLSYVNFRATTSPGGASASAPGTAGDQGPLVLSYVNFRAATSPGGPSASAPGTAVDQGPLVLSNVNFRAATSPGGASASTPGTAGDQGPLVLSNVNFRAATSPGGASASAPGTAGDQGPLVLSNVNFRANSSPSSTDGQ